MSDPRSRAEAWERAARMLAGVAALHSDGAPPADLLRAAGAPLDDDPTSPPDETAP